MNVEFKWIGGATWILDVQGLRIACDPVLCPAGTVQDYGFFSSKRLNDPVFADDDFEKGFQSILMGDNLCPVPNSSQTGFIKVIFRPYRCVECSHRFWKLNPQGLLGFLAPPMRRKKRTHRIAKGLVTGSLTPQSDGRGTGR